MKIIEFHKSDDWLCDVEMSNKEWKLLLESGKKHCPQTEIDSFLVNWSIIEGLKNYCKLELKNDKRRTKRNELPNKRV
jgi:hypothetical protein